MGVRHRPAGLWAAPVTSWIAAIEGSTFVALYSRPVTNAHGRSLRAGFNRRGCWRRVDQCGRDRHVTKARGRSPTSRFQSTRMLAPQSTSGATFCSRSLRFRAVRVTLTAMPKLDHPDRPDRGCVDLRSEPNETTKKAARPSLRVFRAIARAKPIPGHRSRKPAPTQPVSRARAPIGDQHGLRLPNGSRTIRCESLLSSCDSKMWFFGSTRCTNAKQPCSPVTST